MPGGSWRRSMALRWVWAAAGGGEGRRTGAGRRQTACRLIALLCRQVAVTCFTGAAGYIVAGFTGYQLWLICRGAGVGGGTYKSPCVCLQEARAAGSARSLVFPATSVCVTWLIWLQA